jgi:hypothetical protein
MSNVMRFTLAMLLLCSAHASVAAPLAPPPSSGASLETSAVSLQASGDFQKAGAMFQRAADQYRHEGNATANIKAIQQSAEAYERQADTFARGGPNRPYSPIPPAIPPYVPAEAPAL